MNYRDFYKIISADALTGAYLLHGDEEYVKECAVKAAFDTVPKELRVFNTAVLTDAAPEAVIESCETLPLFYNKRVIICRGITDRVNEKFYEYLTEIPDTAVLLIVIKGEMQEKAPLLKHFRKIGRDALFTELSEYDIAEYCVKTAYRQNVRLDMRAARFLIERVGTDMAAVKNELQKAVDAAGEGGTITKTIISECTTANQEYRVFEMLDKFTSGRVSEGMRALHSMLSDESEAMGVAAFLESRFKLMLEARLLLDSGLSVDKAAARLEGNRYASKKACLAAKKYSAARLRKLVKTLSSAGYLKIDGGLKVSVQTENAMLGFEW